MSSHRLAQSDILYHFLATILITYLKCLIVFDNLELSTKVGAPRIIVLEEGKTFCFPHDLCCAGCTESFLIAQKIPIWVGVSSHWARSLMDRAGVLKTLVRRSTYDESSNLSEPTGYLSLFRSGFIISIWADRNITISRNIFQPSIYL